MADASTLLSGTANTYEIIADLLGVSVRVAIILLFIISIWALIWKGFALWKSARKTHKIWFIVLLVINTIGILEILYIFIFSKINLKSKGKTKENSPAKVKKKKK